MNAHSVGVRIVSSNRTKFRKHAAGGYLCWQKFPHKFCKIILAKYTIFYDFFPAFENGNFHDTTNTTGPAEAYILLILQRNIFTFCKIACKILQRLWENIKFGPEFSQGDSTLDTFSK